MKTKTCNSCKIQKLTTEFYTKGSYKGKKYLAYICKMCQSIYRKVINKTRKESIKISVSHKKCNKCKSILEREKFSIDNYQKTGLSQFCISCQANYYNNNKNRILSNNRKSQTKNKKKRNAYKRRWSLDHREEKKNIMIHIKKKSKKELKNGKKKIYCP